MLPPSPHLPSHQRGRNRARPSPVPSKFPGSIFVSLTTNARDHVCCSCDHHHLRLRLRLLPLRGLLATTSPLPFPPRNTTGLVFPGCQPWRSSPTPGAPPPRPSPSPSPVPGPVPGPVWPGPAAAPSRPSSNPPPSPPSVVLLFPPPPSSCSVSASSSHLSIRVATGTLCFRFRRRPNSILL